MLLALTTSATLLVLAAGCAHRLWFSTRLWQALMFLPPMVAAWAGSLLARTPSNMGALVTFLAGDMALYVLGVLAVMRMLGGLPVAQDEDGGDGGGGEDGDTPAPWEPIPGGGTTAGYPRPHRPPTFGARPARPRPARRYVVRPRLPDRDAPLGSRAPKKWSSDQTD